MRKPTASGRKTERSRGPAGPPPSPKKSAANRAAKAAGRRQADRSRTAASRNGRGEERRATEKTLRGGKLRPTVNPPASASRGKYVYCIIEAAEPLRFGSVGIGADPSEVYTVHYKNLGAVVSDAPLEVLDSTRENVLAHERVNETVMREHTVIPMSFGTVFKTREDIIELLRSAAEAFGDVLNKMQNKLEFGLKVLWDRDQAVREVESEDEDISRL